jgi:translocation and assembly module TamA
MRLGAALAARLALGIAALLAGCASLPGTSPPGTNQEAVAPVTDQPGLRVEIDAPPDLKALLEKHLDFVRLGRLPRDEVDDSEWSRLIDAAPAQVRDLLQTEGYFKPQVELERDYPLGAGQAEVVRVTVQPGERARVARMRLEVEGELERGASAGDPYAVATLERLRQGWELPVGAEFRNARWTEAKAATLARLRAAGYATASWLGTGAEIDPERNTARLHAVVESGPLFRFGSLQVEGLVRQDAQTVENMLAARPGTPVTESMLLDFQERLQKSFLFEGINITLDVKPEQAGAARIVARLRESALQVFAFGVGISSDAGPQASVEHQYRRLFGYAAGLRWKLELGKKRQAADAEIITHPLQGLYRNLIGGAVERLISDDDIVRSQRARIGRSQDTLRLERLYYLETERSTRETTAGATSDALAVSLNFRGGWRALDSIVLPTEGASLQLHLGVGHSRGNEGGVDAEAGPFTRVYGRLVGYLPLGQTWYGQARVELGQVFLRPNMVVPESQKWRAGGDESVRGYGYRSLGPLVDGAVASGTSLFTASAEVARPILTSTPTLWGAVFVDAGNASDQFSDLEPVLGAGVGLRWRSPVGPLRLDWAYARELRAWRLHFGVGIAF